MNRKSIGTQALSTVLSKKKNIEIFEKVINKLSVTDEDYIRNIYQFIGDTILKTFPLTDEIRRVKNGKIGWKHPMYNTVQEKLDEHDSFIVHPFEVVEGINKCNRCQSMKTYSYSKQTRSSDESTTVFCTCAICGLSWTISG